MFALTILVATLWRLAVNEPERGMRFAGRGLSVLGLLAYLAIVGLEQIGCRDRWPELLLWPDLTAAHWMRVSLGETFSPFVRDLAYIRTSAALGTLYLLSRYPVRGSAGGAVCSLAGAVVWFLVPLGLICIFDLPCHQTLLTTPSAASLHSILGMLYSRLDDPPQ